MPSLLCMENITGVEETQVKGFKCIKISTNIRDNRDHILRAEVLVGTVQSCWKHRNFSKGRYYNSKNGVKILGRG